MQVAIRAAYNRGTNIAIYFVAKLYLLGETYELDKLSEVLYTLYNPMTFTKYSLNT